jgi:hypothetical protein
MWPPYYNKGGYTGKRIKNKGPIQVRRRAKVARHPCVPQVRRRAKVGKLKIKLFIIKS